jgi:hypothetical protein
MTQRHEQPVADERQSENIDAPMSVNGSDDVLVL